jgi:hypothetical protein
MEGGVGLLLLLVILVVAIGFGIALYVTGGALWSKDSAEDDGESTPRPRHKAPTTPAHEHTHFVGTPEGDEAARRRP